MKFKKFIAFTLGEVLITLGIVGVVAAMTIPTLRFSHIKKERGVKLQKFYSKMDNAVEQMNIEYAPYRDMAKPDDSDDAFDWYMQNIDPLMGHSQVDESNKKIYFADGSSLGTFFVGGCLDVDYDVNGDKNPNQPGYDRFRFLYCFTDADRENWFGNKNIFFGTYASGINVSSVTRSEMLTKCANKREGRETNQDERFWCSRLLQNDQWEFKSDYPWKF